MTDKISKDLLTNLSEFLHIRRQNAIKEWKKLIGQQKEAEAHYVFEHIVTLDIIDFYLINQGKDIKDFHKDIKNFIYGDTDSIYRENCKKTFNEKFGIKEVK
jgi:hypothetical protein